MRRSKFERVKHRKVTFYVDGIKFLYKHPPKRILGRMKLKAESEKEQYPDVMSNFISCLAEIYVTEIKGGQVIKLNRAYMEKRGMTFAKKFFDVFVNVAIKEAEKDVQS